MTSTSSQLQDSARAHITTELLFSAQQEGNPAAFSWWELVLKGALSKNKDAFAEFTL